MDSKKIAEILCKRKKRHHVWLDVSKTGYILTTEEARELERLGYGKLHGGDNGVFWLYPTAYPLCADGWQIEGCEVAQRRERRREERAAAAMNNTNSPTAAPEAQLSFF